MGRRVTGQTGGGGREAHRAEAHAQREREVERRPLLFCRQAKEAGARGQAVERGRQSRPATGTGSHWTGPGWQAGDAVSSQSGSEVGVPGSGGAWGAVSGLRGPSLFEVRPGADDVVQSLPRRQDVADVTVSHQQVAGRQVALVQPTLDQGLGGPQRRGVGRLLCKTRSPHPSSGSPGRSLRAGTSAQMSVSLWLRLRPPPQPIKSQIRRQPGTERKQGSCVSSRKFRAALGENCSTAHGRHHGTSRGFAVTGGSPPKCCHGYRGRGCLC